MCKYVVTTNRVNITNGGTLNNLASERVRLGMTQEDLGKRIGVSKQSISNWEVGTSSIGSENIRKLVEIFKCSADYLLGIKDERK